MICAACIFNPFMAAQIATAQDIGCNEVRPIISWWSRERKDNFATSDPFWGGPLGVRRSPDYTAYRLEGHVLQAAIPGRTIPLFSWYSQSRGDNFITSDPRWAQTRGGGMSEGYRFVRLEGHIFDPARAQPPGTRVMDSSWSRTRGDNFASTDPRWVGARGTAPAAGPEYTIYRREGFLLEPQQFEDCDFAIDSRNTLPDFAITNIRRNTSNGLTVDVTNTGATGTLKRLECRSGNNHLVLSALNIELEQGGLTSVFTRLQPIAGSRASCTLEAVATDGVTPEPPNPNNQLSKFPQF